MSSFLKFNTYKILKKFELSKVWVTDLFPRIIFYFWEYFFEYTSLIPLKKSELLYVWVTGYSQEYLIIFEKNFYKNVGNP